MKALLAILATLAAAGVSANVAAATPAELAKQYNCLACHSVDKKMVGPSFKDVAAKYKGQAGAENKLVDKVKKGGSGSFGPVPMPPNPQVPDADVRTLVKWVLAQ